MERAEIIYLLPDNWLDLPGNDSTSVSTSDAGVSHIAMAIANSALVRVSPSG